MLSDVSQLQAGDGESGERRVLAACLKASLAESTAHALPRLVSGKRPARVRVVWLALFGLLACVFGYQAYSFVLKLIDRPETTGIQQDSVPMVFPELFLCPQPAMSGSYGNYVSNETADQVNGFIHAIARQLNFTPQTDKETETFIRILLSTMPYRLLSDEFAHQFQQAILYDLYSDNRAMELAGNSTGSLLVFHSPSRLNCFHIRLTAERRAFLEDPRNFLTVYLFSDAPMAGLYPTHPRLGRVPYALIKDGVGFSMWDPEYGMSIRSGAAMTLQMVPPGHYPTDAAAAVLIEPGSECSINLRMSQLAMQDGMECVAESPKARIVNPYTEQVEEFEYSDHLCWIQFKELMRYKKLGCIEPTAPRLKAFSYLPRCSSG
ncbi:hypothetical protein BOX15_Mlig020382g2 [Macrostomum lignano]|uniref:Uncharacterized protein n=1 Tax=Macrostomum lignano TaxID=282301 RepID=A0A267FKJ0_9PLAT|nr:hypothetical protein BOX15_Mlig020382g2 [Macrostomum lignano]